eukprot:47054-Eustigmatos_ZCMA.PRE.1
MFQEASHVRHIYGNVWRSKKCVVAARSELAWSGCGPELAAQYAAVRPPYDHDSSVRDAAAVQVQQAFGCIRE